jgi:hypothetical protein
VIDFACGAAALWIFLTTCSASPIIRPLEFFAGRGHPGFLLGEDRGSAETESILIFVLGVCAAEKEMGGEKGYGKSGSHL